MSNELTSDEQKIRTVVLLYFSSNLAVTQEEIEASILRMKDVFGVDDIDVKKLARNIEVSLNVRVGGVSGALGDDVDHMEWLKAKKSEIDWKYWERYKHWLLYSKNMPLQVVDDLENTTDSVLGRLESPERAGTWDRRGLVVGHVQSGKTGHYTGLICKAADAGYRMVIVLSGVSNALRRQTQIRLTAQLLALQLYA